MSKVKLRYVIVAPTYRENSGGTIFLHQLVHALNERGQSAAIYPMDPVYGPGLRHKLSRVFKSEPFKLAPSLNTPVIRKADIQPDTIVVYPELVLGNPLGVSNVVRWLLYTPGVRHAYEFGFNEMFFRVDEFADLPEVTGGATDLFLWKVNKTYQNEHRPDRKGACFIVRKWGDKPRHSVTEGAVQIDGMSHAQINDIFNSCEIFYSYDDATMYSQYAAVCGCLSVVLPSGDPARDDTLKQHMLGKYGIAYGLEEDKLMHAKATQDKVLGLLQEREAAGHESVDQFIDLTKARFGVS